jgi:hypothetical protein
MEWVAITDDKAGLLYYLNTATNQTSWTKPPEMTGQGTAAVQPCDWTEKTDPNTGKVYYFNKATKQTSWTRPSELGAMGSAPPPAASAPVQGSEGVEKPDPKTWKV